MRKPKRRRPAAQRVKRVSRQQETGEAMGGGREKRFKEEAKLSKAKTRVELEAN